MASKLYNLARMTTATTGTGTITLGAAVAGYLTFAQAGAQNGDIVDYAIKDGDRSEIGFGVYTSSGTTLTRTPVKSTSSDAAISLSGTAEVFITPRAGTLADASSLTSGMLDDARLSSNVPLKSGNNDFGGVNKFTNGTIYLNSAIDRYIYNDGSRYHLGAQGLTVNGGGSDVLALNTAKAWVNHDANGSILGSFNVSSVSRPAGGTYIVNFATAMPNAGYACAALEFGVSGCVQGQVKTTTTCQYRVILLVGGVANTEASIVFFG